MEEITKTSNFIHDIIDEELAAGINTVFRLVFRLN